MPEHTEHRFERVISTSDDGRVLFGCTFRASGLAGCGATEVRHHNQMSPFAARRAAAKAAAERRKSTRGAA